MDNENKIKKTLLVTAIKSKSNFTPIIIFWVVVIFVSFVLIAISSTFNEISLSDQTRLREIMNSVMQNTIPITPDIKNEFRGILTKYNTTDADISDFSTYGPAFMAYYQKLFWIDAFQAISVGNSVKSNERLDIEKNLLSRGLVTLDRIQSNDKEMMQIASHLPFTGPDGKQIIVTTDMINNTLQSLDLAIARLKSLFE